MARKRVTLREVARTAGVHISTVSRALDPNSRHLINAEIVSRIVRITQDLDYRPNAAAYSLKTNRTRTIGVIIPDITNAIFPPIIRGVEDSLAAGGYLAILGNTDGAHERERDLVDTFLARGVDGLILASVEREDDAVERATAENTPVVTVNRQVDRENVSSVAHDETEGIRRVLTHLASLGHRKVAMIAGPQTSSTGARRYAAFQQFRAQLRLEVDDRLVAFAAAYNEASGEQGVEELIAVGGEFTAIVCGNDRLAVGAIAALARLNLKCPGDISVTGYNDMSMVDRIDPPLTTVRIQQYRMGREAGAMLQRMIAGQTQAQHIVLPVELMIRGSTAAARRSG
jgi:LacI family transcriptional regulator